MKWPALLITCLVMGQGALAAPQGPPPPPAPPASGLPNVAPQHLPAFLELFQAAVRRHQATESPLFTAPSAELPAVETPAKATPVLEAVAEVIPVVEKAEVIPVVEAAGVVPVAEAEVIVTDAVAGPQPRGIALVAEVVEPSARSLLTGRQTAALKSKDRPIAGPPTQAQAIAATSTPRPYSGYLPPAEPSTSNSSQGAEPKSAQRLPNSYLPPPLSGATGPNGQAGQNEFTFTFESPDGSIPPEFLKHFASASEEPDAPTGGTSRSTTSTWHTFQTYEFEQTAPGLGGTGPSQPGTGSSQSRFSGPGRKITLELPGDFPSIGASLLGLAGLGGPPAGGGTGNLDQPAPGPDSLIPVEPQFARQIEDALALEALALDNPDLNVVEQEFNGATPVVSPAKVGEFVPDAVLFRETVEPTNPVSQEKIIATEPKPTQGSAAHAASPGNTATSTNPTFGKGLQPTVQTGFSGATGGGVGQTSFSGASPSSSPSFNPRDSSFGTQGSPGSGSVFPSRRDGPSVNNFRGTSFGGHPSSTTSRPFFSQNSFTTTTQRPFVHTTPSPSSHRTFGQNRPLTSFHNSFNQHPVTNTRGTFSHTGTPSHSQGTFSQTRPANNFHSITTQAPFTGHHRTSHQSNPQVNTDSTFTHRPVTSAPGTFNHRPTHNFQTTFTQSTTHQRPFTQATHGFNTQSGFSQARPATHASFTTTTRPATHFQSSFTRAPATSHQRPFTQNTQSRFTQARPATNTQTSFTHSGPNANFQTQRTFGPTRPPANQVPRAQQATFIQINPQNNNRGNTFRQTGTSATTRPRAGPAAPATSSAARLPNFNDPNFDSYAFYSDLRNLYGTPK